MILLLLVYVVLPVIQVAAFLASQPFLDGWDAVNYALSVAAFQWFCANLVVGAKIPWVRRLWPYDWRVRFHVWAALAATAAVLWHTGYKLVVGKDIDWVSWSLLSLVGGISLLGVLWIPVPGFRRLRQALDQGFRRLVRLGYDGLKKVHQLLFAALAGLMYIHIVQAEVFSQVDAWSGWVYGLSFALGLGFWLYSRVRWFWLPRWRVTTLDRQGGIHHLRLAGRGKLKFQPGQFAFLRFDAPALRGEEHPFSFLVEPNRRTSSQEWELGFGLRESGDFTRRLGQLKVGDTVRVNGGYGAFGPTNQTALCFVSSGIGATPFFSLVRDLAARQDNRPLRWFASLDQAEPCLMKPNGPNGPRSCRICNWT